MRWDIAGYCLLAVVMFFSITLRAELRRSAIRELRPKFCWYFASAMQVEPSISCRFNRSWNIS
jgi:hypothetical protein